MDWISMMSGIPKNEEEVILVNLSGEMFIGYVVDRELWFTSPEHLRIPRPSYWMPLPDPPIE